MDPIIILIAIAVLVLLYQTVVVKDYDKLDQNGQLVYFKNKKKS